MPVTESFLPKDVEELKKNVQENKSGQEAKLIEDVKAHLGLSGSSLYRQSPHDIANVDLILDKYVVFLIKGKFKVSGDEYYQVGYAYRVENEKTIQLAKGTLVIIIDN